MGFFSRQFFNNIVILFLIVVIFFFPTAKGNVPEAIKGGFLSCDTDMQKGILPRKSIFSTFYISACLICLFVAYLRWTDERWNGWNNSNSCNPQKSENILCKSEYICDFWNFKWNKVALYQWKISMIHVNFNVNFLFLWRFREMWVIPELLHQRKEL